MAATKFLFEHLPPASRPDEEPSASPNAPSPFCTREWFNAWRGALPPEEAARLKTVRAVDEAGRRSEPIPYRFETPGETLPALVSRFTGKTLRLLVDDLGAPDHLDLPLSDANAARALAGEMKKLPWSCLVMENLAAHAPMAEAFADAMALSGCVVESCRAHPCFYKDLPKDKDAFWASLGSSFRTGVRRKARALDKAFKVEFPPVAPADAPEFLSGLFAWNRERFGARSTFHDPALEALVQAFCARLGQTGGLRLLSLRLDGEPAGGWLGFSQGGTMSYYQAGWAAKFASYGVGVLLMLRSLELAAEEGCARYDFLRGDETFKTHWANGLRYTRNLVVSRDGVSGAGQRLVRTGWGAFRAFARAARRRAFGQS